VAGIRVGHWSDPVARTGCTVVLLPAGSVASGEVRGGAPGTREWALLAPERTVEHVDAVVLTGGSAFGLAACDGVVRWCEERGLGYPTQAGPVPIVVGMVLYDLGVGDPTVRPVADSGYAACIAATDGPVASGQVGAGTGATVAKWPAGPTPRPGGLGSAQAGEGPLVVAALMAVNALGDLRDHPSDDRGPVDGSPPGPPGTDTWGPGRLEATTIGLVATNADLSKAGCHLLAQSAHDGLARALDPVHTTRDGDAVVAVATGPVEADLDVVRVLAARVVEAAVRDAVGR
jgi:L-aminopeptidase/D-esterase-like protein